MNQNFKILFTSFLAITATELAHADSAKLVNPNNGHAYQRFDTEKTWDNSKTACEVQGAHLVTITSQNENDWIIAQNLINTYAVVVWAGGTDRVTEGQWQWITGETWGYTNWGYGEPNNVGNEDYLEIWNGSTGTWNDEHSYHVRRYICEWDNLTPPTLHATTLSPTVMRLSRNDNATGEKSFRIQRKTGDCSSTTPWVTVLDVPANGVAAWDIPVTPDTPYSYQIASYYGGQTFSPYSACVSATSAVAGTPIAPNNEFAPENSAASQSNSQVNLRWNDASNNETRFDIYRKVNTGNWALLKSVPANTQSYADTTAAGNMDTTSYSYAVSACNNAGCSSLYQIPMVVPFSPSNLAVTAETPMQLSWQDNSNNETGFQLLRKTGDCASTNFWSFITGISANKQLYKDYGAVSGQTYSYQIRSYTRTVAQPYGFGYSGYSNCVTATAP